MAAEGDGPRPLPNDPEGLREVPPVVPGAAIRRLQDAAAAEAPAPDPRRRRRIRDRPAPGERRT